MLEAPSQQVDFLQFTQYVLSSIKLPDRELVKSVRDIIDLPDRVLQDCGLLPDSLDTEVQAHFLQGARTEAKIKRTWLYYLLINPGALLALPPEAEINLWKAEARVSVAALEVIEILYENLEVLKWIFKSPYQWWFECEYELCHTKMSLRGLIGEPLLWGKHKLGNKAAAVLKQFEEPEKLFKRNKGDVKASLDLMAAPSLQEVLRLILSGEIQEHLDIITPNNILWLLGTMTAIGDNSFWAGPWLRMYKAHKRWNRVSRNQSLFPVSYLLADGRIQTFKVGGSDKQSLADLYRNIKKLARSTSVNAQNPDFS